MTCSYDPEPLKGVPLGMFHCPECGDMVAAGFPHPPPDGPLDICGACGRGPIPEADDLCADCDKRVRELQELP